MSSPQTTRIVKFVNLTARAYWLYDDEECDYLMLYPESRQILARFLKEKLAEDEALAILKYFFGEYEIGEVDFPLEGKELKDLAREAAKKVDFVFIYMLLVTRPGEAKKRLDEISSLMLREGLKDCVDDLTEASYICEYFPECDNELAARFEVLRATVSAVLNQLQVAIELLEQ